MPDFEKLLMFGVKKPGLSAKDLRSLTQREEILPVLERARLRLAAIGALIGAGDLTDAAMVVRSLAVDIAEAAGRIHGEPSLINSPLDPEAAAFLSDSALRPILEEILGFARANVQADSLDMEDVQNALLAGERAVAALDRAFADMLKGPLSMELDAYEKRKSKRLHLLLAVAAFAVCATILSWDHVATLRRERAVELLELDKEAEARNALEELANLAFSAKQASLVPLTVVTGEVCTQCGCEEKDLRSVDGGDKCRRKWDKALKAILAANARAPEARFEADPWGAPYLLNENEKEQPGECVKDVVSSAGRDGRMGTADDLSVAIDNVLCKN